MHHDIKVVFNVTHPLHQRRLKSFLLKSHSLAKIENRILQLEASDQWTADTDVPQMFRLFSGRR